MLRRCSKAAGLLPVLLLAGCAQQLFESFLFSRAEKLAWDEMPCAYAESPRDCDDTKVREIFFLSLDRKTKLQALYFPNPNSDKAIVYFHGNGSHLYTRVPDGIRLSGIANVFLLSYRSYGKSEGRPTETGLYEDAEATLKYVREELKFAPNDIYIYGRSLGAAIAVEVAQSKNYAGLILVSPFLSGKAMAEKAGLGWWPGLGRPFHSVGKVSNITSPALFIHGNADKVVPYEQGRALYKAYRSPNKTFKTIKDGSHNQIGDEHWEWIEEFIAQE